MDEQLELIELVRKNEFLYDKNHRDFTHKKKKQQKWQEISKTLHLPVERTKRKWRTLRDRFYRTQKAFQLKSNSGTINVLSNYKYAKSLSFLNDYYPITKKRFSTDNEENMNTLSQSPNTNMYFLDDEETNAIQTDEDNDGDDDDDDDGDDKQYDVNENDMHEEVTLEIVHDKKAFEEVMMQNTKETNLMEPLQLYNGKTTKELSFCSNLAYQLKDAKLPVHIFAKFQMEVFTSFHRAIQAKKEQGYIE